METDAGATGSNGARAPLGLPRQRQGADVSDALDVVLPLQPTTADATIGTLPVVEPRASTGAWLRRHGLALEIALALGSGLAVATTGERELFVSAVLAVWALSNYHSGRAVTSPLAHQLRQVLSSLTPALAFAGVAVGLLSLSAEVLRDTLPAVVGAGLVSTVCRAVRWRLQAPVRVVAVGDRVGVGQAIERFVGARGCEVVGAVIVEADIDPGDVDAAMFAVPVTFGLPEAASFAELRRADLVVVTPGPGFTSLDLKRLHHTLQASPVAVGVMGVLDAVAPHRIRAGWVARSTVLDIRSPRPSGWVRLVKAVFDRVAGLALMAVVAVPLLVLVAVVKIDSRGPAIFKQVRVGRSGKHFTLYKLRTMVGDAEAVRIDLSGNDVADSLLFKMRSDPRVTRVGRFLRRYSLDELPQLINVVKGDMSLVGPRPFLPDETARMDADAMRRLAVAPGITGVWQVSGRSDLDWEESVWLDVYYADNWSLAGDLKILAQTLPAVLRGKGAY